MMSDGFFNPIVNVLVIFQVYFLANIKKVRDILGLFSKNKHTHYYYNTATFSGLVVEGLEPDRTAWKIVFNLSIKVFALAVPSAMA